MMAFVLGALALAASGKAGLAGVSWALAITIKWVPLLFLPLRFLEARETRPEGGPRGLALGRASSWRLPHGATACRGWERLGRSRRTSRRTAPGMRCRAGSRRSACPRGAVALVFALAFVAAYAWLLREAWRGRARLALTAGILLVCTSWLVPWYAVWAVRWPPWRRTGPPERSLWRSPRISSGTRSRSSVRYAVVGALISVAEAQRLVLERATPLEAERVPIERATGRVLAEPRSPPPTCRPFQARRWTATPSGRRDRTGR